MGMFTQANHKIPYLHSVIIGNLSRVKHSSISGYKTGLLDASGEQTIWPVSGNFTQQTSASTYTITYTNSSDGSTANGAKTLLIEYIDSNGERQEATHTLGSTGSDVTSFTGLGINKATVATSGSTTFNGSAITISSTSPSTVQSFIPATQSVSQQMIYHAPSNGQCIIPFLWFNISGTSNPKIKIKAYIYNRIRATREEAFRVDLDLSISNTFELTDGPLHLERGDTIYFVSDTDTDAAAVNGRITLLEYRL